MVGERDFTGWVKIGFTSVVDWIFTRGFKSTSHFEMGWLHRGNKGYLRELHNTALDGACAIALRTTSHY